MWKYFKAIFFLWYKVVYAYFAWMIKYSKHKEKYPIEVRYNKVRKIVLEVLKAFNVTIKKENFEEFNDFKSKNRLIVCNHLSLIDPLIIIAVSEKPVTFVCKKEILKLPLVPRIVNILDGEYLDREDLKQQLLVMKNIENKLRDLPNLDWCIFPEGTRNKSPYEKEVSEFHHGTFRCSLKSNSDITLLSLFNTFKVLDKHNHENKYIIPINFITTLNFEDYKTKTTNALAIETHQLVNDQVKEYLKIYHN